MCTAQVKFVVTEYLVLGYVGWSCYYQRSGKTPHLSVHISQNYKFAIWLILKPLAITQYIMWTHCVHLNCYFQPWPSQFSRHPWLCSSHCKVSSYSTSLKIMLSLHCTGEAHNFGNYRDDDESASITASLHGKDYYTQLPLCGNIYLCQPQLVFFANCRDIFTLFLNKTCCTIAVALPLWATKSQLSYCKGSSTCSCVETAYTDSRVKCYLILNLDLNDLYLCRQASQLLTL